MKNFLFLVFLILSTGLLAQIPNGDFETWVPGRPLYWQVINNPNVPLSIEPDSDAHSGFLSAHGFVVLNNNNLPSEPYLGYEGPSALGFTVTQPYASMGMWVKLHLEPGDIFYCKASLYDSLSDPVGEGIFQIDSSVTGWTYFNFPITYDTALIPKYCAVYFTITDSGGTNSGQIGSDYYLDDISLSGINNIKNTFTGNSIVIFPNPSHGDINVKIEGKIVGLLFDYSDINGNKLSVKKNIESNNYLERINPGMYFFNFYSAEGIITKRVMVK